MDSLLLQGTAGDYQSTACMSFAGLITNSITDSRYMYKACVVLTICDLINILDRHENTGNCSTRHDVSQNSANVGSRVCT